MVILVLNCGSSSIKYQVIDMMADGHKLLAKGLADRIGLPDGVIELRAEGRENYKAVLPVPNHKEGIRLIIEAITHPGHGVVASLDEIKAAGHRVAHGGEFFKDSALVDDDVVEKIKACIPLAPLHNKANLQGITSMAELMPGLPQVAVFDTSFHQTIPAENYMYALPWKYWEKYRVRKFGFHGTSHKFVAGKGAKMAGLDINNSRIITCHIGNGGSVTAVLNGRSLDTSMGFTPVDGLMMGTRTGSIDPGALIHIAKQEGMDFDALGNMMNKDAGVWGVTGISSDMRDIVAASEEGNERAALALAMYDNRVKHFIGAYAALMGGVDMVIFTGGVGENQYQSRDRICSNMEFLGIEFDAAANDGLRGQDKIISKPGSRVTVAVVTTDEELVIAKDTYRLTAE